MYHMSLVKHYLIHQGLIRKKIISIKIYKKIFTVGCMEPKNTRINGGGLGGRV